MMHISLQSAVRGYLLAEEPGQGRYPVCFLGPLSLLYALYPTNTLQSKWPRLSQKPP